MNKPKLIVLNGFAGAGKSTIGKLFIDNHPLALLVEGDELIVNLGQWQTYENKARSIVYELTKSLVETHLVQGHDVILPYLVTNSSHLVAFKEIAESNNAMFYNVLLTMDKEQAVNRLLSRGTWGEKGLEDLSKNDLPAINDLFDRMQNELSHQTDVIKLPLDSLSAEQTYLQLMDYVLE